MVGSFLAGVAALAAGPAVAAKIDLFDDRKAVEKGFDLIYEARDLDLPQVPLPPLHPQTRTTYVMRIATDRTAATIEYLLTRTIAR